MAYDKDGLVIGRGKTNNFSTSTGLATHSYVSAVDNLATIQGASYFPDLLGADADQVKVEDLLMVRDSTIDYQLYRISGLSPLTIVPTSAASNPFNQDLNTTDSPTFDTVTTTTGLVMPTSGGTPATLNYYETGTFNLNLTGGFAGPLVRIVRFEKLGTRVTFSFDFIEIVQTGAGFVTSGADIPARLRPPQDIDQIGLASVDNGTWASVKTALDSTGIIKFSNEDDSNYSGVGNLRLQEGCLTYIR